MEGGLDELLATCQKLPTQVGFGGLQLKRGVAELDEASKALGASSSVVPPGQDLMGAVRLLSQRNFDAVRWSQDVDNLSVQTPYFPSEHLETTDIEGYLTHHHDMIILNAVNEAKRGAEYDVREMHRRWASNEWATSKRQFLDSLGHRALRDLGLKGTGFPSGHAPSSLTLMTSPAPMSPYHRGAAVGGGGAFPAAVTATPSMTSRMNAMIGEASTDLSNLLNNQAAIVRTLNQSTAEMTAQRAGSGPMGSMARGCPDPCAAMAKSIEIPQENVIDTNGLTTRDLINYQGMLNMLSEMVGEQTSTNPPSAGYFSTICFDPKDVAPIVLKEKRKLLTSQTLRYLEKLVEEDMLKEVDTAVRGNQLSLQPCRPEESKSQRVQAYVQLLRLRGVLHPVGVHASAGGGLDVSIFALIYYYLRVGMLSQACEEMQQGIDRRGLRSLESMAKCLTLFKEIAGLPSTNGATLTKQKSEELLSAIHACGISYDEERNNPHSDPFRLCILNLLSLRDHKVLPVAVSLEDFLWSNLWFIRWSQMKSKAQISAGLATQRTTEYTEMDLHDQVLEYGGANHFDKDISGPFNYARVLFCCHRFGDAIAHLWHTGKSLPAAHITVLCLHYGLILPHQPLAHNPRRANVAISSGVLTPAALFQAFFQSYLPINQHPTMCVDYLASLNAHWNDPITGYDHVSCSEAALIEIQKLKCEKSKAEVFQMLLMNMARDQLTALVGTPREDVRPGEDALIRTGGWLDRYMSPATVTKLLTLAAHQQLTVRRDGERAIVLFQLAGRHSDVLEELCNKLSEAMASGDSTAAAANDANYFYWKQTSVDYHAQFINTGDTTVTRYLEADQRLYLVGTFETLLNLAVFMESAWAGQYREAFNVLDRLNLFPQHSDEVSPFAQQFSILDKCLRRIADQILVLAVESAKALFIQLRSETTGGAGMGRGIETERDVEVRHLKERVKSLVMFASMIRTQLNKPNTPVIMARIEDSLT